MTVIAMMAKRPMTRGKHKGKRNRVSCVLPCLQDVSHDGRHVIPSRALSPQHDEDRINMRWPNKARNSGFGGRGEGQDKISPRDSRAKGRWGSQWLTPNGDRPANGSSSAIG